MTCKLEWYFMQLGEKKYAVFAIKGPTLNFEIPSHFEQDGVTERVKCVQCKATKFSSESFSYMCTDAKPRENWELSSEDISQEYVHFILSSITIDSDVQVEHAKKAGTVCLFYSIVLTKGIFKWDFILDEILSLNIWFQNKERNAISRQQATDGAERKGKTKVTGSWIMMLVCRWVSVCATWCWLEWPHPTFKMAM